MSIKSCNRCDTCNCDLTEGSEVFCFACIDELRIEIEDLKKEIAELQEAK